MTTRPNHPLPRQVLHLQVCQSPKAAHRNLPLGRPHVLSAARVNAEVRDAFDKILKVLEQAEAEP
jgi:hypothetical protein